MQTAVIPEVDGLFIVHHNKVEIAKLDGSERRVLIEHPKSWDLNCIVVDPVAR